jgi:hypothetical protein
MYTFEQDTTQLFRWIRDEIEFVGDIRNGTKGNAAKRVQEWLNLHGHGLDIDSDFGAISERGVKRFQTEKNLPVTGIVDKATHAALIEPMLTVLKKKPGTPTTLEDTILAYAETHLKVHPREIGGQNRGPWVRLYMSGKEGDPWAWCAGFVTFLLNQACETLGTDLPIKGSVSCDLISAQGKQAGLFLAEKDATHQTVKPGSIFLVRRTSDDWTHTGLVTDADDVGFDTIEGNTNDEGVREGFEVCKRTRGYKNKDFVLLTAPSA